MDRPLYNYLVVDKKIYVTKTYIEKDIIPNIWVVKLENNKVINLIGGDDGEEYEKVYEEEA